MHEQAARYLLKRSAASELAIAIREAMQGRSYVTPLVTGGMVEALMRLDHQGPAHELTPRQREVLQLLAEGRSMKEVAGVLHVTPRTVAFHKYKLMERLGLQTNADLIQYAIQEHIVAPRS